MRLYFVNAYEPLVKCEQCGHEDATLSLLAAWFGLDQHMLEKKLVSVIKTNGTVERVS